MSLHTMGYETDPAREPVTCVKCGEECDRGAQWVNLGSWRPGDDPKDCGWQWVCRDCRNPCADGCQIKEHKGYRDCRETGQCQMLPWDKGADA